jgi:hypothetical protein
MCSTRRYERGYPVGFKAAIEEGGEQKHFLHNHLRFAILYHKDVETDLARIVGFEVREEPRDLKTSWTEHRGQLPHAHTHTHIPCYCRCLQRVPQRGPRSRPRRADAAAETERDRERERIWWTHREVVERL